MTTGSCCEKKGCCSGGSSTKDVESQETLPAAGKSNGGCGSGGSHRDEAHSHGHSHSHGHNDDDDNNHKMKAVIRQHSKPKKDNSVLCLAVVRESGADVVLFDARGVPRTFSYRGGSSAAKVCFSSHGQDADDLLSPCFDEDGNHGMPEESCFCGLETPHLHAHVHDPKTCEADEEGREVVAAADEKALMNLAKLTLHPVDDEQTGNKFHIPITEQMPNECNAEQFINSLSNSGHNESTLENRVRMHQVQVSSFLPPILIICVWYIGFFLYSILFCDSQQF